MGVSGLDLGSIFLSMLSSLWPLFGVCIGGMIALQVIKIAVKDWLPGMLKGKPKESVFDRSAFDSARDSLNGYRDRRIAEGTWNEDEELNYTRRLDRIEHSSIRAELAFHSKIERSKSRNRDVFDYQPYFTALNNLDAYRDKMKSDNLWFDDDEDAYWDRVNFIQDEMDRGEKRFYRWQERRASSPYFTPSDDVDDRKHLSGDDLWGKLQDSEVYRKQKRFY